MKMEESPHIAFREGLTSGVLRYQKCACCGKSVFYPRLVCPYCGAQDLHVEESAGRGSIYSITLLAQRDGPSNPLCLVDLDEGFRMMSTVVGVRPEDVEIGQRVAFVAEQGEPPRATFEIVPSL